MLYYKCEVNSHKQIKGGDNLTDVEKLKKKIKSSGISISVLAEKTGILRETLYNRFKGNADFRASEIDALTQVLALTKKERDDIFFAPISELNSQE